MIFVIASLLFQAADANYLTLNIGTSVDGDCSQDSFQFSVLKQVGVCLLTPASVPYFRSYQLLSCVDDGTTITSSIAVYMSSDCTGIPVSYPIDNMSSGCNKGSEISCETNPVAIAEAWPALGVYIEDSTCSHPTMLMAAKQTCSAVDMLTGGQYSSSVSCTTNEFSISTYNNSLTCQGDLLSQENIALDICTETIPGLPPLIPADSPAYEQLNNFLNSGMIDVNGVYYYADCAGSSEIPGVEGGANDDAGVTDDAKDNKSSGDDTQNNYGGLGTVGLSLLVVFIAIGAIASAFVVVKFVIGKSKASLSSQV
jgi:hypothetical protein